METEYPTPRKLRLIPLTVTMLALLFVIKLNDLYINSQQLREIYTVNEATAEEAPAAKDAATPAAADAKTDSKDAAANPDKPADTDKKTDTKSDDDKKADAKDATAKKPDEERTFGTGKSTVKEIEAMKAKENTPEFSQNEIDLLQNLAKRRDELDQREKELDIKSKVLDATQKRIDDKIAEMKTLEAQLSKVVALYNEKQDAQIKSLVKIYENMKPVQAAEIFNQLDMPILLEVIDKMSERKVAPVLAQMDPKRARDVTAELAAMRKSAPGNKKPLPGEPGAPAK